MEQKFGINTIDVKQLRVFCEQEGQSVQYQKGEQIECEGQPSQWFGFVVEGCFKYVTRGISDRHEHITWFSFAGEFVGDYPSCLDRQPSKTTIEAMMPSRVHRISGEQLMCFYYRNTDTMELRSIIGEHLLNQARARYLDFHRTTPRERYELLMRRCPGIVEHLPLNVIASFLNISPKTISMIRRDITFGR
ncbi:MAG: cyclic nucleotide-binding domain-containing protein [Prevotella sp.]|nr:cyclic nucleotide-binding domain-containing protein [Prevotella sp.]